MSGRKVILSNYAGIKSVVAHSKIRPNLYKNPSKPGKNLAEIKKHLCSKVHKCLIYRSGPSWDRTSDPLIMSQV